MHLVERAGRQVRQLGGERRGGGMGEVVEGRIEIQRLELGGDGVDDLAPPVADISSTSAA